MPLILVSLNTIGEDATIYIYIYNIMFNDKQTTSLWTVVFHPSTELFDNIFVSNL